MSILVEPQVLRFDERKTTQPAFLKIYNIGDRAVKYIIKSNNRKAYEISHASGTINPQCYVDLTVKRAKFTSVPNEQLQIEAKETNRSPPRLTKRAVLVEVVKSNEREAKTVRFDEAVDVSPAEDLQEDRKTAGVKTQHYDHHFYQAIIVILFLLVTILGAVVIRGEHSPLVYDTVCLLMETAEEFLNDSKKYIAVFACGALAMKQFVENVQLNFPGQLNKRLPRKSAEKPKQVIIPRPVINRDEPIADPIAFNLPLHRTRPAEKKQSVIEEIDNEDEPPAKRRNDAYTARIEAIYQEYLRTIATLPEPVFGVPRAG
ncbi:hypothetical protein QR680_011574 [Steinernema hermaphroditum]|uniref:MSP domain-containing protein n=1 Tax=Steinernema hermaphroditum TaxID=289476 RepID=A0AA39HYY3_9BILA|nr:hypothetical protein QR680_011574 [Steinernema hermaphroditum]